MLSKFMCKYPMCRAVKYVYRGGCFVIKRFVFVPVISGQRVFYRLLQFLVWIYQQDKNNDAGK